MRSNRKHTLTELANYIHLYDAGHSYKKLCENYGLLLGGSSFNQYYLKFLEHDMAGLESSRRNNTYTQAFKESVVKECLQTDSSIKELARKYHIPSHSTVKDWIIKYTEGEQIKNYRPKPEVYIMKEQKKTHQEKIAIVKDFLETGMSYKETAAKHQVSYNNIYFWVQKYQQFGPDGLTDGRGRRKPDTIQTEEEKLRTENAALKARNEYLETENAALKKLKEVGRELMFTKSDTKQNTRRLRNLIKMATK
ncbi:transposase [Globicatella sp. HMSC072A10]|uniref:helix-turn-helix domain-containing protein n=1 Tax=Globicatella sp. HMSC072A10 TaxID=1739315 RepID=UPI0008D1284C|nr:helix-turn-helix domain-containing protein [Globicatella sp. HMSC072A10]OFK61206.1 transposase [Globicatella sp. HMSC072A10]